MFASRAGQKLDFALQEFNLDISGAICADLGCSTGGFTDCLLHHGAKKVFSIDTGYGVLDWKLRNNPQVVVMERTNALFATLPELMDFVSVDVSWTPQRLIIPKAIKFLKPSGILVSLLKPHYEAHNPKLSPEDSEIIANTTLKELANMGFKVSKLLKSPILGEKGKNTEYLFWIQNDRLVLY